MKRKWAKKRFYLCGIMTILIMMIGFSEAVKAQEQICTYEIYHKHIGSCETTAYKTISADRTSKVVTTRNDACSNCGGHHDYYEFTASCSCGKTWKRTGHACINSPAGSYKGSCPNYSKVDANTSHSHPYKTYTCGYTEESVIETIIVEASTLLPAQEVILSARTSGALENVTLHWEDGNEEVAVKENGVYHLFVSYYENEIEYISDIPIEVNNIDTEPPVVDEIMASETEFTNTPITLTVAANDNMGFPEAYISWNGGEFNSENTYVITENGTYEATIIDQAGNAVTKAITVTNIDTSEPQIIKMSTNPSKWYSGTCTVSVEAVDMGNGYEGCGLAAEAYSWDEGITWVPDSFVECTEPGIVKVLVRDALGNVATAELEVKKLKKSKKTSNNAITEWEEIDTEVEVIEIPEENSESIISEKEEDISKPVVDVKDSDQKEKEPNYLFLPEYEAEYTVEQILPETDYYLNEKESDTVEIVEKENGYQVGIIICASLVMAGLMIIGIFCYLISVCSVYEKDKNNRENYLGKARMRQKNKEYIIKIAPAVLDKANYRTLVIKLPIWKAKRTEYKPVKILLADQIIETFAEKEINIQIKS